MAVLMTTVLGKICSFDARQTQGSLDHKLFWGGAEGVKPIISQYEMVF